MAFTFSDLNKLNIESLSDVITLTVSLEGELSRGLTVLAGIANGTPIVTLTAQDKALRKSAGCDDDYKYSAVSDGVKYYEHAPIALPVAVCLQDLWGKMVAKGVHLSDDFGQVELAAFLMNELNKVLEADLLRLSWLDGLKSTDAEGEYSIFKAGGFIKQMQDSTEEIGTLVPTGDNNTVLDCMKKCIDTQRADVKERSEFFVTSNVMRSYKNILQDQNNTTGQMILEDGRPQYYFEGYKINELPHVSASAKADGLTVQSFIAFTPKDNLHLATEDASIQIAPFKQDAKDRRYYSTTLFAADAKVAIPEYVKLYTAATA